MACYDDIQYNILSARLELYYGITGLILGAVDNLFKDCWTRTIANNIGSNWLLTIAGLGQGRTISPILNLLFLEPIHNILSRSESFKILIFADDIILYSILCHNYSNLIQIWLQQEINNLESWIEKQNMELSAPKTKWKLFYNTYIKRYDNNIDNPPILYLKSKLIEQETKPIKYLGYYLSYNLNKQYYINYIIKKASFSFFSICRAIKNIKNIKTKTYHMIIKACVLSILSYANIFLITATQRELKTLKVFYNKILRYLSGARKHTPIEELYLFTGFDDIYAQIETDAVIYWNRLLHLPETNPIYELIDRKWYNNWKLELRANKLSQTTTLKTYEKKTIFWKSFQAAKKHNIIETTNFNQYSYYSDFYKLNKYTVIKPILPKHIKIISQPYDGKKRGY